VTVYVTLSARLTRLHTMRCRASGDSGAADEYRSGRREKMMGTVLPDAEFTGYANLYASVGSSIFRNCSGKHHNGKELETTGSPFHFSHAPA
jgi:hypothetical protein